MKHAITSLFSTILLLILAIHWVVSDQNNNEIEQGCNLPDDLISEIRSYGPKVNRIIQEATTGRFKGFVYDQLSTFTDKFGNRLAGTTNLENAIDFMLNKLKKFGLDNVHGEEVIISRWERYVRANKQFYKGVTSLQLYYRQECRS
ncbi:hypothetical protein AMK59_3488 [Oryctes borbonicus]|uniref:Uncharacterized protein n=1 Tax=Oryctes borbonicus TaxID=1629725 RepID=A0A0T6B8I5_9SCAR|nr:hypothetical protein AMK59_3488 [Oryctes borbonicus]